MKPIETKYGDRVYRSRTEARWAVALTVSAVPFEYEKEGFALPSGWYLPDFWLPKQAQWLEIKGLAPTDRERRLAMELEAHTGHEVIFGIGSPAPSDDWQEVLRCAGDGDYEFRFEAVTPAARGRALAERFDGKALPTDYRYARSTPEGIAGAKRLMANSLDPEQRRRALAERREYFARKDRGEE